MWLELRAIVEHISLSDARVIVLSSFSDKFFTAGLDCKLDGK
jgi:enoyl-CoA hydratase/carnithine racemase